jgi:ribosomal protein L29
MSATFDIFESHLDKFLEIRAIPRFDNNNNLIGLIHVVRDITERKTMEQELKKRIEELEKFYGIAVGRELKMKDLKKEIARLKTELLLYKEDSKK